MKLLLELTHHYSILLLACKVCLINVLVTVVSTIIGYAISFVFAQLTDWMSSKRSKWIYSRTILPNMDVVCLLNNHLVNWNLMLWVWRWTVENVWIFLQYKSYTLLQNLGQNLQAPYLIVYNHLPQHVFVLDFWKFIFCKRRRAKNAKYD